MDSSFTNHSPPSGPSDRRSSRRGSACSIGPVSADSFDPSIWRIVDANANRTMEGLRVAEDYCRFAIDAPRLTHQLKRLRHQIGELLQPLARPLSHARNVSDDVGRQITEPTERQRSDPHSTALVNLKRAQQALRCLEEYGKIIDPTLGAAFERIRYASYQAEQRLAIRPEATCSLTSIGRSRLYVLIDAGRDMADFRRRVARLVAAGVDVLQLRVKQANRSWVQSDRHLLQAANALRELTETSSTLAIINDRPDMAVAANLDGVHVGQDDLPVSTARAMLRPQQLLGVSTHALKQALAAVDQGADYLGAGPTFASQTKTFDQFAGLDYLRQLAEQRLPLPIFAIGGIDATNVDTVLDTGIKRVAISAAVWQADDPAAAAKALCDRLQADAAAPHQAVQPGAER